MRALLYRNLEPGFSEQSLTGEIGRDDLGRATTDRDEDCVQEVDDAQKASVLAAEVHYHAP